MAEEFANMNMHSMREQKHFEAAYKQTGPMAGNPWVGEFSQQPQMASRPMQPQMMNAHAQPQMMNAHAQMQMPMGGMGMMGMGRMGQGMGKHGHTSGHPLTWFEFAHSCC